MFRYMEEVTKPKKSLNMGFIAFLGLMLGVLTAFIVSPSINYHSGYYDEGKVANGLFQSMQTSAAIYVAQQRVPPKSFADFVTANHTASTAYTLSLANVLPRISQPLKIPKKEHAKMQINFKDGGTAIYYINGTDISATFTGF